MLSWFLLFMVAVGGFLTPVQASVNAMLGRSLGHPVSAAVVSTMVSFSLLAITALVIRVPWPGAAGLAAPWWVYVSGGAVIAGQLIGSVALDHFGALGLPQQAISPGRALGIAFLIAGVFLIRKF